MAGPEVRVLDQRVVRVHSDVVVAFEQSRHVSTRTVVTCYFVLTQAGRLTGGEVHSMHVERGAVHIHRIRVVAVRS